MDLDEAAWKLLAYLERRVTVAVGDNAERIAQALGLAPAEFEHACDRLCAHNLATREPMTETVFALRITDEGIAASRQRGRPAGRPWWKWW